MKRISAKCFFIVVSPIGRACHSRERGNPFSDYSGDRAWIPAFAGMTVTVGFLLVTASPCGVPVPIPHGEGGIGLVQIHFVAGDAVAAVCAVGAIGSPHMIG